MNGYCLKHNIGFTEGLCPNCEFDALASSESKPSEAGAREATVSGPTLGSPERERGDQAGPESQQPRSPAEPGGESEVAAYKSALQDLFMAAEDMHDAWEKFLKAPASAQANKGMRRGDE